MPRKAFELLYFLMTHPNQVFSRDQLLEHLWGPTWWGNHTVDVHVRKLREKIGEGYLVTVKGVGYLMRSQQANNEP